jgi:hypothetical protein
MCRVDGVAERKRRLRARVGHRTDRADGGSQADGPAWAASHVPLSRAWRLPAIARRADRASRNRRTRRGLAAGSPRLSPYLPRETDRACRSRRDAWTRWPARSWSRRDERPGTGERAVACGRVPRACRNACGGACSTTCGNSCRSACGGPSSAPGVRGARDDRHHRGGMLPVPPGRPSPGGLLDGRLRGHGSGGPRLAG